MYPRDKKKSQLFFLSIIQAADVIETVRVNDPVEVCAKRLKFECKEFDFGLNNSFRYANGLKLATETLGSTDSLQCWDKFFDVMFLADRSSEPIRRKCDVIFQIVYNLINNG